MKWNSRTEERKRTLSFSDIAFELRKKLGDLAPSANTVGTWFKAGGQPKREQWAKAYKEIKK